MPPAVSHQQYDVNGRYLSRQKLRTARPRAHRNRWLR